MEWKALYSDWSEYGSENGDNWKDLPELGVIWIKLIAPSGHTMKGNGYDFYAIRPTIKNAINGYKVYLWKDTVSKDINGDPLPEPKLNKGHIREYYDDCTGNPISYTDASEVNKNLLPEEIKRGQWVDDETAKQMGIL